jgi:hypothetical protein
MAAGVMEAVVPAETGAAGWKFAGIDAITLMLRATRTRKPARSISISVRLVSSSNIASSRMIALSSLLKFAADLSADLSWGWRAMLLIRNSLGGDG